MDGVAVQWYFALQQLLIIGVYIDLVIWESKYLEMLRL